VSVNWRGCGLIGASGAKGPGRAKTPIGGALRGGRAFPVLILTPVSFRPALSLRPPAVELRLDLFSPSLLARTGLRAELEALDRSGASLLVTARRKSDGGAWPAGDEEARRKALWHFAAKADAVDLEADLLDLGEGASYVERVRERMKRQSALIVSHHDGRLTPATPALDALYESALRAGAARLKVATLAKKSADAERLARWAVERASRELPITAIAMGLAGSWTRWTLPRILGGPAYAPYGREVAPGQINYGELSGLLGS
jgi:3-dehydroquinate dehydratase type I